jgi:hypothetical protein
MGFRWYKGRFLSDNEYSNLLEQESNEFWYSVGMLIPVVILGIIGYLIGNGWGCFIGIVLGAIIGHILNRIFVLLSYVFIGILIIYIIYYIAK